MKYVEGAEKGEPTEEHHENARLMIQLLRLVLEKEMSAEDKAYASNRSTNASNAKLRSSKREEAQQPSSLLASPDTPRSAATIASPTPPGATNPKPILKRKASTSTPLPTLRKRLRINNNVK